MPATRRLLALVWLLLGLVAAIPVSAQDHANHIAAELVEGSSAAGQPVPLVLRFVPQAGWHGYWSNPGDAGYGMRLDWTLPAGWKAGEPRYPVPQPLVIGGLMNHVYEGPYAVLVDLQPPPGAAREGTVKLAAQWLACTDRICVPEHQDFALALSGPTLDQADYDRALAAIPAELDRPGAFALEGGKLRLAIPLPAALALAAPHVFVDQSDLIQYGARQAFSRDGDRLVVEIPLAEGAHTPPAVSGILALGNGNGVRFSAAPGPVPSGGSPLGGAGTSALWLLLLGAFAGGLVLNVMPCVFPILSLKALSLARAGESDARARAEGLAYTAGVVLACLALGALLLALRTAGEQVGWAFQLQQPGVVVALLLLAVALTANFAGVFELPSLSLSRGGERMGAFATGLLAAFVATPCTGPFMAAAMGAALLLPTAQGLALFAALGLGLAFPFLLIGFVPALRRMLPRPGKWMETFRKIMAVPMGLTALALVWLCWRLGGPGYALLAVALAGLVVFALGLLWGGHGERRRTASALAALAIAGLFLAIGLPKVFAPPAAGTNGGVIAAQPFSDAALAEARATGKPVFVWFTADWCLTCKVNERVAIEREATRDAFRKAGVVALVGDWTRRDPAITRFLTAQGVAGVPLYLWYPPGGAARQLDQVLTPDTLVTLAREARSQPDSGMRRASAEAPRARPAAGSARSARPGANSG
jgi:DsbC/DsbD-like thiol-disulfide interchange protein/cytochrome c biogenesis protein CcdA